MRPWIISDTHFGHKNIIEYCSRPFWNVQQMNETMIRRWKERVAPDDIIYHLGDVGLTMGEYLKDIITQLPGKKILILGNHDKSAQRMMEFGFDFACEEITIMHMQKRLRLIHKPQPERSGWDFILHGHIHNSTPERRQQHKSKGELVEVPWFNVNLSVEVINYEPVSLSWVVKEAIQRARERK